MTRDRSADEDAKRLAMGGTTGGDGNGLGDAHARALDGDTG